MISNYIVVIPCRGLLKEVNYYDQTLSSLEAQTIKPRKIFVVQWEGSEAWIEKPNTEYLYIKGIRDEVSFFPVVPKLNRGFQELQTGEHFAVSGDDTFYPPTYFETLLHYMEANPGCGILSGEKFEGSRNFKITMPSGSGRLYNKDLIRKIYPLPMLISNETLMLYECVKHGFTNDVCRDTFFDHLRPRNGKSTRTDGQAAYELGFPFVWTLARGIDVLHSEGLMNYLQVILGHVEFMLGRRPQINKEIQQIIRQELNQKIIMKVNPTMTPFDYTISPR